MLPVLPPHGHANQPSALSAMLGASSNMATAILGGRTATPTREATSLVPEADNGSPSGSASPLPPVPSVDADTSVHGAAPALAALALPPELQSERGSSQHTPEASGAVTPTINNVSPPVLSNITINDLTSNGPVTSTAAPPPTSSIVPATPESSHPMTPTDGLPVPMPRIIRQGTQFSQMSLLTPGSINSETAEEYDFLPSSLHESDVDEAIIRAPLMAHNGRGENEDEGEEDGESDSSEATASDSTEDGDEPVRVVESDA